MIEYGLFIANEFCPAQDNETIDVQDPSTGQAFATVARGRAADIAKAVDAAQTALEGEWGSVSPWDRGRILLKVAAEIERHFDELVSLESMDTGKTLAQAAIDIRVAIRYFEYYGGLAGKIDGYTIPFEHGFQAMTIREPFGVTGHILPWNYPAQMFARDVSAALAAGNALVVKPAESACLSALYMSKLMVSAGLPAGAVNVITGYGTEAGEALSQHPAVEHVSFTGSPAVGALIQQEMAKRNRGCTMELGGKSPQIVFADADIEKAIGPITTSIVMSAGQTCSAGSRLLVEEAIYPEFIERFSAAFSKVQAGTPSMDLQSGPVINSKQQERVQGYIDRAKQDGIPVIAEGRIAEGVPTDGFFVKPIVFGPVPREHELATEEIFGPVLTVMPFQDEADAIALSNATEYGLVANIWTRDGGRQMRMAKAIRCGQVFVNGGGYGGNVELPFGGVKMSGFGREKGLAAIEEYSTLKTVLLCHG